MFFLLSFSLLVPPSPSSYQHTFRFITLVGKTCLLTTDLIWLILKQLLMKFSRIQSWCFIWKHTKKPIHCPDMDTLLHLINANTKHSSRFYFNTTIVVTVLFSRKIARSFRLCLLFIFCFFSPTDTLQKDYSQTSSPLSPTPEPTFIQLYQIKLTIFVTYDWSKV